MEDWPEAAELEAIAAWRLRKADENPDDTASVAAAEQLQRLADGLRAGEAAAGLAEYRCICNWLAESDGIEDLNHFTWEYRTQIGFQRNPDTAEAYVRDLLILAKETFGAPG